MTKTTINSGHLAFADDIAEPEKEKIKTYLREILDTYEICTLAKSPRINVRKSPNNHLDLVPGPGSDISSILLEKRDRVDLAGLAISIIPSQKITLLKPEHRDSDYHVNIYFYHQNDKKP